MVFFCTPNVRVALQWLVKVIMFDPGVLVATESRLLQRVKSNLIFPFHHYLTWTITY